MWKNENLDVGNAVDASTLATGMQNQLASSDLIGGLSAGIEVSGITCDTTEQGASVEGLWSREFAGVCLPSLGDFMNSSGTLSHLREYTILPQGSGSRANH